MEAAMIRWWHRWRARVWTERAGRLRFVLDNTPKRAPYQGGRAGRSKLEDKCETAEWWALYYRAHVNFSAVPAARALPLRAPEDEYYDRD